MLSQKKYVENKLKKKYPQIHLTEVKTIDPFDSINKEIKSSRHPAKDIYMVDIQILLCRLLCGQLYNIWPRWCRLVKPDNMSSVHLIVVDGMSLYSWSECLIKYSDSKSFMKYFEIINAKLDRNVKFVNPKSYGITWKEELFEIPTDFITHAFRLKKSAVGNITHEITKSLKRHLRKTNDEDDIMILRKKFRTEKSDEGQDNNQRKPDAFPRTNLLMNTEQMTNEHIPQEEEGVTRWIDFKYSVPSGYSAVTDSSPIYALDCEMVECMDPVSSKITKDLASVSIIDENRSTVYHKYVKPANLIVNYLTPYSGITPEILESTTTTLEDVRTDLANILPPDVILAGHSIGNDLVALKLFHPYVIDTSVIFNLKGLRGAKSKLKVLSYIFLNREIQCHNALGHDSLEDALATMDLIRLKLSQSIEYGDATVVEESDDEKEVALAKEEPVVAPISPVNPVSVCPQTSYSRHGNFVQNSKKQGRSVHLIGSLLSSLNNPVVHDTVATVNDKTGFSQPWFPDQFHQILAEQNNKSSAPEVSNKAQTFHIHPLKISEVSCHGLADNELPSRKWMSKLLKKIVAEIAQLPAHALCGLMVTDGAMLDVAEGDHSFGRLYFGITPPTDTANNEI